MILLGKSRGVCQEEKIGRSPDGPGFQLFHQKLRTTLQTLGLGAIGLMLGTAASWALARVVSGLLFGVTRTDPVTFFGMAIILAAVAVTAGYLPARRASRIDPMTALRS